MKQFYATYELFTTDLAIFETEQERDDWVAYKDPLSLLLNDPYYEEATRVALTDEDVEYIYGSNLAGEGFFEKDEFDERITWLRRSARFKS